MPWEEPGMLWAATPVVDFSLVAMSMAVVLLAMMDDGDVGPNMRCEGYARSKLGEVDIAEVKVMPLSENHQPDVAVRRVMQRSDARQ